MIIFVVHDFGVLTFKVEGNPPISTDINSPCSSPLSFQFVKPKARKIHILWLPCSVKATEYQTQPVRVLGLDSRNISSLEEPL